MFLVQYIVTLKGVFLPKFIVKNFNKLTGEKMKKNFYKSYFGERIEVSSKNGLISIFMSATFGALIGLSISLIQILK